MLHFTQRKYAFKNKMACLFPSSHISHEEQSEGVQNSKVPEVQSPDERTRQQEGPSRFLKLPTEVRMLIYEAALVQPRLITIYSADPVSTGSTSYRKDIPPPGLLQVSRQVRIEALFVFYRNNRFHFNDQCLPNLVNDVRQPSWGYFLRHVQVSKLSPLGMCHRVCPQLRPLLCFEWLTEERSRFGNGTSAKFSVDLTHHGNLEVKVRVGNDFLPAVAGEVENALRKWALKFMEKGLKMKKGSRNETIDGWDLLNSCHKLLSYRPVQMWYEVCHQHLIHDR